MGGGTGFLTGTSGTRDGVDCDIFLQQVEVGCGQQSQLDGSGKATGIGYVLSSDNIFFVDFRQSVDVVVIPLDTEVLSQVDNFDFGWDGVLLQKLFALAVAEAEEDYVNILEWHLVSKPQVCVADEAFMHIAYRITCITLAIGEDNLSLGVVQQQTDEFSARVSCRT